ncbi:MAG: hypothetical protein HUU35_09100, partial [Armatimonadetes bacterium]|nr:hypothetical protein [Armatimonadota bacterium]
VEVERQGLENRQTYAAAALDFEQAKLSIQAARDIQVAMADAIGQLVARGNFQIYGDPSTLGQMMNQLSKGLGFGAFAEGLIGGAPEALRELAANLGDSLKPMLESPPVAKSNGDPTAPAEPASDLPMPPVVDTSEPPEPPKPGSRK